MCKSLCVKCPTVSPLRPAGKNKCKLDMITVSDLTSSKNVLTVSAVSPTSDVSLPLSGHTPVWESAVLLDVRAQRALETPTRSNGSLSTGDKMKLLFQEGDFPESPRLGFNPPCLFPAGTY